VREFAGPEVQWILYGALMILVVFLLPQGVVPAVRRWIEAWTSPVSRDLKPLAGPSEAGGRS
jgi:branched-chain amino acid transport system permease protein